MSKEKILAVLLGLAAAASTLLFVWLFCLEFYNYDNFVFSTYRINIYKFGFVAGIFPAIFMFYYLTRKKSDVSVKILAVIFCLVSLPIAIQAMGNLTARTASMFKGKDYIMQKSMQTMYGGDYKFMDFIKSYLKEGPDAVIMLPPNVPPWRHTGSTQIMNSYLYPATTTNITESAARYILISSETESAAYHLWPDFKVPADKIIIFNWEGGAPTIIENTNWDPEVWQDKKPWGLIIKKDE